MKKLLLGSMQAYIGPSSPTHRHCERRAPFLGSKARRGNPAIKVFAKRLYKKEILSLRDLFNWVAALGFASKRKHAARNDGTFGGNAPPKLAHCIFLCLGLMTLVLPTTLSATKDSHIMSSSRESNEESGLLKRANPASTRKKTTAVVAVSALVLTVIGAGTGAYFWATSVGHDPTPLPPPTSVPNNHTWWDPCDHDCWYLREQPTLPQGGYYFQHEGEWIFVNCTTGQVTNVEYSGQVGFNGTHDGFAVCQKIATLDDDNNDEMPELVEITDQE